MVVTLFSVSSTFVLIVEFEKQQQRIRDGLKSNPKNGLFKYCLLYFKVVFVGTRIGNSANRSDHFNTECE